MLEDIPESEKDGPIQCIFFSEFHADYGPRIVCQVNDQLSDIYISLFPYCICIGRFYPTMVVPK